MNFTLNKREFRDAVHLRYDWHIQDTPSTCICGDTFTVDHVMVCRQGGFIIQRHNELRDLEADMVNPVCHNVQVEPVLQGITGEVLTRGMNQAPDAWLDIHARGFWDRQGSAFSNVRVCHPNTESYKDLTIQQIYRKDEHEKRLYANRVLEVELGTFTPLVITTTRGMADECKYFHSRLVELISIKKGKEYSTTISWIHSKVSFALLRSALLCLRGSCTTRRVLCTLNNVTLRMKKEQAGLRE